MRVAIERDARVGTCASEMDMKRAMSKYHWRSIVSTLLSRYRQNAKLQARVTVRRFVCWRFLVQRMLRRQAEKTSISEITSACHRQLDATTVLECFIVRVQLEMQQDSPNNGVADRRS